MNECIKVSMASGLWDRTAPETGLYQLTQHCAPEYLPRMDRGLPGTWASPPTTEGIDQVDARVAVRPVAVCRR